MKVRLLQDRMNAYGILLTGAVLEIEDAEARRFIAAGQAEPVMFESPSQIETAAMQPSETRRRGRPRKYPAVGVEQS